MSSVGPGAAGQYDVLIVGAGPAGASLAFHLASSGARVGLLDARAFPRSKPCGDAVSPGATPLLQELGVWEGVRPGTTGGVAIEGWRIRAHDGSWAEGRFDRARSSTPSRGLAIDRRVLDEALVRGAVEAGAELHERTRVFGLVRRRGRVVGVRARDPSGRDRTWSARFVVGADGLRSRVARLLGPVRRGRRGRLGAVARFEGLAEARPWGELRLAGEGVLGYAPTSRTTCNVTLVVPVARAACLRGDPERFVRERIEAYDAGARVAGGRLARRVEVTGPFEARPTRRSAPGVVLVGDAAGYFDPFTGQGVFRALLGGRLAAAAIRRALDDPARESTVIAAYERGLDAQLRSSRGLQRLVDRVVSSHRLMNPSARLLRARPALASRLVDATGDRMSPSEIRDVGGWLGALVRRSPAVPELPTVESPHAHA